MLYQAVTTCAKLCQVVSSCAKPCQAVPSVARLCQAVPLCAKLCQAVPSCTRLCHVLPRRAWWRQAVPSCAKVCQVVPRRAKLCQAVPKCVRLCEAVPSCANVRQVVPSHAKLCQVVPGWSKLCQAVPSCVQCVFTMYAHIASCTMQCSVHVYGASCTDRCTEQGALRAHCTACTTMRRRPACSVVPIPVRVPARLRRGAVGAPTQVEESLAMYPHTSYPCTYGPLDRFAAGKASTAFRTRRVESADIPSLISTTLNTSPSVQG
jgi:hypothetical protein